MSYILDKLEFEYEAPGGYYLLELLIEVEPIFSDNSFDHAFGVEHDMQVIGLRILSVESNNESIELNGSDVLRQHTLEELLTLFLVDYEASLGVPNV